MVFHTVAIEMLTKLGARVPFPDRALLLVGYFIFVGEAIAYK